MGRPQHSASIPVLGRELEATSPGMGLHALDRRVLCPIRPAPLSGLLPSLRPGGSQQACPSVLATVEDAIRAGLPRTRLPRHGTYIGVRSNVEMPITSTTVKSDNIESWASRADFARLAVLVAGGAVTMLTPSQWDSAILRMLFRLYAGVRGSNIDRIAARMNAVLPSMVDARGTAEEHVRMRLEDAWGRLRGVRRNGWRPRIEIEGLDRVEEALSRGRGAIFWCMRFSSPTAVKQAFHRSGLPLIHLSQQEHGAPSRSKLGLLVVAPIHCRAENPFLAERIQIPLDGSLGYLSELREGLRGNACVSIFGEHQGTENHEVRILGKRWEFALGSPSLAWLEGSGLLPVYAIRLAPFHYKVMVEGEIHVNQGISRRDFAGQALAEYAHRLERLILAHPADWQGWSYYDFDN